MCHVENAAGTNDIGLLRAGVGKHLIASSATREGNAGEGEVPLSVRRRCSHCRPCGANPVAQDDLQSGKPGTGGADECWFSADGN